MQLEAGGQLHKCDLYVVSITDLLIIFVPADIQGLTTADPAFQAVAFTQLYKGSGRKFLDKLRRFCKVKGRIKLALLKSLFRARNAEKILEDDWDMLELRRGWIESGANGGQKRI